MNTTRVTSGLHVLLMQERVQICAAPISAKSVFTLINNLSPDVPRMFHACAHSVFLVCHWQRAATMIKKWQTVSRRSAGNFRIFEAHFVERIHPVLEHQSQFIVLDSQSWVNVIPVTAENEIVFIRQYRHGVDDITLEIPGGLVERGEDPRDAAMRECREETGFGSEHTATLLGVQHPNPAFLNNSCFSYVWENCLQLSAQQLDKNEDIEVVIVPIGAVPGLIQAGEITHSLVLNAFMYYWLSRPITGPFFGT